MPPRLRASVAFLVVLAVAAHLAGLAAPAMDATSASDDNPRRNVVLVMIDGVRWQEIFRGADDELLTKERGLVEKPELVLANFGGATREERRAKLLPFLWSTVAREGTVWGNRDDGSKVEVTNGRFVSYPGYSETICGFVDPAIESNAKIVNPNRSVFEFLNGTPTFSGRVWVFGCWDVFPFIFASARNHLPVDDSVAPFVPPAGSPSITPVIATINRLRREVPLRWPAGHFDAMMFPVALEWLKVAKPRVLFIGLGETDEWAHEGDYARYLEAAHRADTYLAELWSTLQSMPEYRGTTTLIITTDHGRGSNEAGPREWNNHNTRTVGSHEMWIGLIGPGIPARGAISGGPTLHQAQIAATIAQAVGVDWCKEEPRAEAPLPLK